MSCKNCEDSQYGNYKDSSTGEVVRVKIGGKAYYRWGNANIEMNGCDEHLSQIFKVLTDAQMK